MSLEPTHRHIPTTILLFTSPMDANKIKHSKVMMTNRPTGNVGPFYPSQMVVRRFAEFFCPLDGKTLHGTHLYSRKQKWEKIKAEKTLDKYGSWSHGHALRGHRFASPMQPIHWGCNQYFKDGKKKKKRFRHWILCPKNLPFGDICFFPTCLYNKLRVLLSVTCASTYALEWMLISNSYSVGQCVC